MEGENAVKKNIAATVADLIADTVKDPGADWTFAAGDVVVAIGEPDQMAALRRLFAS